MSLRNLLHLRSIIPFLYFLTDNEQKHELYTIPVNILLKDNADDIKEKINNYKVHKVIGEIVEESRKSYKDLWVQRKLAIT